MLIQPLHTLRQAGPGGRCRPVSMAACLPVCVKWDQSRTQMELTCIGNGVEMKLKRTAGARMELKWAEGGAREADMGQRGVEIWG